MSTEQIDTSHMPTESSNGRPHLTFFDEGVSFVWSGSLTAPIEVCPGGYGEPVTDRIAITDAMARALLEPESILARVRAFGDICSDWLNYRDVE